MAGSGDDELAAKLDRVADFEAGTRRTFFTRFLSRVGRTKAFAAVYRRTGPRTDPWLLEKSKGRLSTRYFGLPALMLVSTGARSGKERRSPLLYIRDGDDFVLVGTNFGQLHHPAWTYNLDAKSEASVEVGGEHIDVEAERLEGEEWARLWPRFVETYAPYASYLERCGDRIPRMYALHPVS